jgi:hypothetical protein
MTGPHTAGAEAALERAYLTGLSHLRPAPIPLLEALELHRLVHRCQYRSTAGCGCSGARCGLRASFVSHRDCLACVQTYGAA